MHVSLWYTPYNVATGSVWGQITSECNPSQHVDCANYLFADGHAAAITLEQFMLDVQTDIQNNQTRETTPISHDRSSEVRRVATLRPCLCTAAEGR